MQSVWEAVRLLHIMLGLQTPPLVHVRVTAQVPIPTRSQPDDRMWERGRTLSRGDTMDTHTPSPTSRYVVEERVMPHQPLDIRRSEVLRRPEVHLARWPRRHYDARAINGPQHVIETVLVTGNTQAVACALEKLIRGEGC